MLDPDRVDVDKCPKTTSPARQLVDFVVTNCRAVRRADRKSVRREAVNLAIKAGLEFNAEDFKELNEANLLPCYLNNDNNYGEEYYTYAVKHENTSACRSFEFWKQREPYFWKGKRLTIGDALVWNDYDCRVTSFTKCGSIILCSYLPRSLQHVEAADGSRRVRYLAEQVDRRFRVTPDDLKAFRREQRNYAYPPRVSPPASEPDDAPGSLQRSGPGSVECTHGHDNRTGTPGAGSGEVSPLLDGEVQGDYGQAEPGGLPQAANDDGPAGVRP